jgi:hypothetical protein
MRYCVTLILLSLALHGACSRAPGNGGVPEKTEGNSTSSRGAISGSVVEAGSGNPVPFADVRVAGTGIGVFADTRGVFRLGRIPPGTYTVRVKKTGCLSVEKREVCVRPGETTFLRIELWPLYDYPRPPREGPEPGHVIDTEPRKGD